MSVSENRILRRLAAIVAADVAGYSRLMGADEEGTLRLLTDRRGAMDRLIGQYGGRIANTAGDSVVAEFASVVAAVECAVAIQRSHAASNSTLAPRQRIAFRIGVHLGDVMVKDGDLFGDGVNIAARLEQLAEPGGIVVSARVKEELTGKLSVGMEHLGAYDLKNIARPVEVWRVLPDIGGAAVPATRLRTFKSTFVRYARVFVRRRRASALAGAAGLMLAAAGAYVVTAGLNAPVIYEIRPFTAAADTDAARALAGALTSRLADGLGTIPNVRVLTQAGEAAAKNSSTAKYVISGSVSPGSETTRVDARIVEIATGRVITATNFAAPLRPPDEMQDEILGAVGDDLSVGINRLRYPRAETADAQKSLGLADEARNRVDLDKEPTRATALYDEATRLYPESSDIAGWYANALVAIATAWPPSSVESKAYLQRARAILKANEPDVPSHRLLIYAQCQLSNYELHLEAALAACNRALQVSPWSARAHKEIGAAYMQLGQLERALMSFAQAERLDRRHRVRSTWEVKAGIACLLLDRYREAVNWFKRAASAGDDGAWVPGLSAITFNRLGDTEASRNEIAALKRLPAKYANKAAVRNVLEFYHFQSEALNAKFNLIIQEFEGLYDSNG